jgi:SAM-dependent methyltransferase
MASLFKTAFRFKRFIHEDEKYSRKKAYWTPEFNRAMRKLKKQYRFSNPFRMAKDYGETPLFAWEQMCIHFNVTHKERFVDLGCGRGILVLFAALVLGCDAIGYDCQQQFIKKAEKTALNYSSKASFICTDLLKDPFQKADIYYLCGTCFSDRILQRCIQYIAVHYPGCRVLSVSMPLNDYPEGKDFTVTNQLQVTFPWGVTTVYENRIK